MLECIIIEDDFAFALSTKIMVEEIGLKVSCIISKFEDIVPMITDNSADIILSDIRIGADEYSYEALSEVENLPPVVFFSGYIDDRQYIKSQSVDSYIYLIKPFNKITLQSAIDGALKQKKKAINYGGDIHKNGNTLFVRSKGKLISIDPLDIKYVQSEGNYCYLYTKDGKIAIRSSLKNVFKKLPNSGYFQIHRSYMINLNFIDKIVLGKNQLVIGDDILPIGRKYKKELIDEVNS
jgi:DNA-binding LytR/AlgR family response regulator